MSAVRIVVDTNVFVGAAFKRGGHSAKILDNIRKGEWRLVWHEKTRRETERIIRKIPVISNRILDGLFREEDRFTGKLDPADFGFVEDAEDRKFAALAVAAGVALISNDDHLLAWKDRLPVPVTTPGEFMREHG